MNLQEIVSWEDLQVKQSGSNLDIEFGEEKKPLKDLLNFIIYKHKLPS